MNKIKKIVGNETEKWYESRLLWVGVLEIASAIVAKYYAGASTEILVTGVLTGLVTVMLRLNTKKGVTK